MIYDTLIKELKSGGFTAGVTSVGNMAALVGAITDQKEQGQIDGQLFDLYMQSMIYNYNDVMPDVKSVIVMAHPSYVTKLVFKYNNGIFNIVLPPTYSAKNTVIKAESTLENILKPMKGRFKYARLPLKLLAVKTGLGKYGRNNICYVDGMGSYNRLLAYFTDVQFEKDDWTEGAVMPDCNTCNACIKACPTGCIKADRFMMHAENCLAYINEIDKDFPAWVENEWNNAIVGCMKCQAVCPKNKEYKKLVENELVFDQEETEMIIGKTPLESITPGLRQKLDSIEMTGYYGLLSRNLSVLFH